MFLRINFILLKRYFICKVNYSNLFEFNELIVTKNIFKNKIT